MKIGRGFFFKNLKNTQTDTQTLIITKQSRARERRGGVKWSLGLSLLNQHICLDPTDESKVSE